MIDNLIKGTMGAAFIAVVAYVWAWIRRYNNLKKEVMVNEIKLEGKAIKELHDRMSDDELARDANKSLGSKTDQDN